MSSRQLISMGVLLLCLSLGTSSIAHAEIKGARAKEIEAAFLLQFSKYVTWPDSAFRNSDAPIIVGILGRDPFGSVVDKIARSSRANGRNVEIRRYDDISSIAGSHILFVTSPQAKRMQKITDVLGNSPVLLVSDSKDFLQHGVVNFVMVDKKIRFNISQKNCQKHGLKISSKLLKVAHKVY